MSHPREKNQDFREWFHILPLPPVHEDLFAGGMTFSTQEGDASHVSVYFQSKQPRGPRLCYFLSFGFGMGAIDNKLGTYLFSNQP